MTEIEIWTVIDGEGQAEVGMSEDDCLERYDNEIGGSLARRVVKMMLMIQPPKAIEVSGAIPDEGGSFSLEIKPTA